MLLAEPIQTTHRLAQQFEAPGIRYFVGGSLASSMHGIPRATNDVLGVLQVQGDQLDYKYLERMAHQRGVHDLLSQAIQDAKLGGR